MNTTEQLLPLMHGFNVGIMIFAVSVMLSYIILALISSSALKEYFRHNRFVQYSNLLALPDAPRISLIAPAYNESMIIVESVYSLLNINYNNFDVVVVNDGSKDDTLDILIKTFDLVPSDKPFEEPVVTKKVRGVYVSTNPSYSRLILIDKENGGKADALNAGINIAQNPYVVCIDVDCIMDKDVLLKLAKPFLEGSDKRVIATGGVIRIVNSCIIKSGKLMSAHAPDNMLARIQVLEYQRAFMLGRMAWAKMDGLLLISGAFGMFDREILLACGGYDSTTVGEDMELVVRMRRYMIEHKLPYAIQFIPDPLCWTEAPETYEVLIKQRSRWTRGLFETLHRHRKIFFNPKYGVLGMLSYPYWMIYEYWAPVIEAAGLIITLIFAILGIINWKFFFLLLLFSYLFAVAFSILAIYVEESTFKRYQSFKDLRKLLIAALLEPFIFHPVTVYASLKGNWIKITGKKTEWGDMTRKGFEKKTI